MQYLPTPLSTEPKTGPWERSCLLHVAWRQVCTSWASPVLLTLEGYSYCWWLLSLIMRYYVMLMMHGPPTSPTWTILQSSPRPVMPQRGLILTTLWIPSHATAFCTLAVVVRTYPGYGSLLYLSRRFLWALEPLTSLRGFHYGRRPKAC